MTSRLLFLNRAAAAAGVVRGRRLDGDYVRSCKWFNCGLIDRTRTLRPGVPYVVLDAIPARNPSVPPFDRIADAVGERLLNESRTTGRSIQVLWSGGIDSTVALIALLKAASSATLRARIQVVCSSHSIREYPAFFHTHIVPAVSVLITTDRIGAVLDDACLVVTGEHGDQLFGSVKLQPLVATGEAGRRYEDAIRGVIAAQTGSDEAAERIVRMLAPQVENAPVPVETVFDYLWWVNFSLKWQHVTLRIPVFRRCRVWPTYFALRHFFRGRRFQQWAMQAHETRRISDWREYKRPAKQYILEYTGDEQYYREKTKEPSLKNVLAGQEPGNVRYRVHWMLGAPPSIRRVRAKRTPDAPGLAASDPGGSYAHH